MSKFLLFLLFLFFLCRFSNSVSYSWDPSTPYAKYYTINGTKATQNYDGAIFMYLLTSKQTVPQGTSKITLKINSYGQIKDSSVVILGVGLITEQNKNKFSALSMWGSLEYQNVANFKFASVCIDTKCPAQYLSELYVPEKQIIEITIDTIGLTASFYIPSKGLRYPVKLNQEIWKNKKMYVFFEVKNVGAEVEFIN